MIRAFRRDAIVAETDAIQATISGSIAEISSILEECKDEFGDDGEVEEIILKLRRAYDYVTQAGAIGRAVETVP